MISASDKISDVNYSPPTAYLHRPVSIGNWTRSIPNHYTMCTSSGAVRVPVSIYISFIQLTYCIIINSIKKLYDCFNSFGLTFFVLTGSLLKAVLLKLILRCVFVFVNWTYWPVGCSIRWSFSLDVNSTVDQLPVCHYLSVINRHRFNCVSQMIIIFHRRWRLVCVRRSF